MNNNNLAIDSSMELSIKEESYRLYEEIAEDYVELDKHRGDDTDIILQAANKDKTLKILDAGCGSGWHIRRCLEMFPEKIDKIIGLDFSARMLEQAKSNIVDCPKVQFIQQNILQMELPDSCVDIIVSMNNVLGNLIESDMSEAVRDRQKAINHFFRILKKGGKCVLSVYNFNLIDKTEKYFDSNLLIDSGSSCPIKGDLIIKIRRRGQKFKYYSHWFKKEELINLFSDAGFRIVDISVRQKRLILVAEKI